MRDEQSPFIRRILPDLWVCLGRAVCVRLTRGRLLEAGDGMNMHDVPLAPEIKYIRAVNGIGWNVEIFQLPEGWTPIDAIPHSSEVLAEVRMKTILKYLPDIGELRVYEALGPMPKKAKVNLKIGV